MPSGRGNIPEALRMRYEQADNHIGKEGMKYVEGRALLQTIHFLEKPMLILQ